MKTPARRSAPVQPSQLQLPIWPQDVRGFPNAISRSALFNVANARKGERANYKRKTIASLSGIEITYSGEELRQCDEDLWMQVIHMGRVQELGTEVRFTANAMLTELGWTKNSGSYKRLVDCMDRLKASAVTVTIKKDGVRKGYSGSLIRSFKWKEDFSDSPMREWVVLLEPEIIVLFQPSDYSRLDWKLRLKLPPLAKWLHSFYHSHAQPYPYKVETLHGLTGSEIAEMRQFRYKLKKALELLVESGFLASAHIDARTDLVFVQRADQAAQTATQRLLA